MELISKSGYPEDIRLLKLVATFETRSRLHVKIFDAEKSRYEVNILNTYSEMLPVDETDYEFAVNTGVPGFSVSRKISVTVIYHDYYYNPYFFVNNIIIALLQVIFSTVGVG